MQIKNYNIISIEKHKKVSALSSGKGDKYDYLIGEEKLPSDKKNVIEQAKFIYSPVTESLVKHRKTVKNKGKKLIKTIEDH